MIEKAAKIYPLYMLCIIFSEFTVCLESCTDEQFRHFRTFISMWCCGVVVFCFYIYVEKQE